MAERTGVAIVGAGPAGLVLAHLLNQAGLPFIVVERQTFPDLGRRPKAGLIEPFGAKHDAARLAAYSATRLPAIWRAQAFSNWFLQIILAGGGEWGSGEEGGSGGEWGPAGNRWRVSGAALPAGCGRDGSPRWPATRCWPGGSRTRTRAWTQMLPSLPGVPGPGRGPGLRPQPAAARARVTVAAGRGHGPGWGPAPFSFLDGPRNRPSPEVEARNRSAMWGGVARKP
jgi:FAD binding domain